MGRFNGIDHMMDIQQCNSFGGDHDMELEKRLVKKLYVTGTQEFLDKLQVGESLDNFSGKAIYSSQKQIRLEELQHEYGLRGAEYVYVIPIAVSGRGINPHGESRPGEIIAIDKENIRTFRTKPE